MRNLDVSKLTDEELDQLVADHEEWERWKARAKEAFATVAFILLVVVMWLLDLVG
jgi:hypothetical protein